MARLNPKKLRVKATKSAAKAKKAPAKKAAKAKPKAREGWGGAI